MEFFPNKTEAAQLCPFIMIAASAAGLKEVRNASLGMDGRDYLLTNDASISIDDGH